MNKQNTDDFNVIEDPERFNDAFLRGKETDAYLATLDQPVNFLIGELWGERDRRNTQDGAWQPLAGTWRDMIVGADGDKNRAAFGLSRHSVNKSKEGSCVVLGSSIGQARKGKSMEIMHAMGLDIDSGASLDAVLDKVEEPGLFCVVYTTHLHGRRGLQLKHDEVLRKLGIKTDPMLDQVQEYLRTHDKIRYEESYIAAVTIKSAKKQVKAGVVIELDTPPLDKFRLIFPLAVPVTLVDLAETHAEALTIWEDKITGPARETIGVHFDTACTDPSRLFFLLRHPKESLGDAHIVRFGFSGALDGFCIA